MHRARFLDELVKGVPTQRAYFNKRLLDLEEGNEGVLLRFADGTTATADAVVGADGIRSTVRRHLLGKEGVEPVYTGNVAYRGLVPMDIAIEKVGAEFAQNSMLLCGPGTFPSPLFTTSALNLTRHRKINHQLPNRQRQDLKYRLLGPRSPALAARKIHCTDKFSGVGGQVRRLGGINPKPPQADGYPQPSRLADLRVLGCALL